MELNHWENTKTNAVAGVNKHFGSPRGWIGRAYDTKFANDSASLKSTCTLDPREVTAGAIFYRPCTLPDFGNQRVLYRFFHVPIWYAGNESNNRGRKDDTLLPVIGVALALPVKEILTWKSCMGAAGASWVWTAMPQELPSPTQTKIKTHNTYNYVEIYELLEQGLTSTEIANKVNGSQPAISYIRRRWLKGLPPQQYKANRNAYGSLNHEDILSDRNSGMTLQAIADKNNTSRQTIFSICKKYG